MFDITKIKCPLVAVDAIIELNTSSVINCQGIVLIERKYPPLGLALIGGFVDYGESLEDAVKREVKEETGLDFEIKGQLRVKSKPDRDPRAHIISVPFWGIGTGEPIAQDDAKAIKIVPRVGAYNEKFAFQDHKDMILEYIFAFDN